MHEAKILQVKIEHGEKRKYLFLFLFTLEIFILTRKRMIPHHLCVGIGDGLRLP